MTAQIIDMMDWKYTKIAKEFIRLRKTSPKEAADYAKSQVSPKEFKDLSKYIELEMIRGGDFEPNER